MSRRCVGVVALLAIALGACTSRSLSTAPGGTPDASSAVSVPVDASTLVPPEAASTTTAPVAAASSTTIDLSFLAPPPSVPIFDPLPTTAVTTPVPPVDSLPVLGELSPDPIVLSPPATALVNAALIQSIRGTYDLDPLLVSAVPLVLDPRLGPAPTGVAVGVVAAGSSAPVAAFGDAIFVSYQLLRWDTAEVADATPANEPTKVVLGSTELPTAISEALEGVSPGSQRVALFPAGTPGLPDYIPDDVAYLLVATISAVIHG